jgi:hypothetical protein
MSSVQSRAKEVERKELTKFFDDAIEKISNHPQSINSRLPLGKVSRANICHIFPKRKYKSIECHTENYIKLTIEEHTRFDRLLDNLDFDTLEKEYHMCWKTVLKKIKILLPRITEIDGHLYNAIKDRYGN